MDKSRILNHFKFLLFKGDYGLILFGFILLFFGSIPLIVTITELGFSIEVLQLGLFLLPGIFFIFFGTYLNMKKYKNFINN